MRYLVNMKYYIECEKELTIYACDEGEAEEKAIDIVSDWKNVCSDPEPEVIDINEE